MFRLLMAVIGLSMHIFAQPAPPKILQIFRDVLKPDSRAKYNEIEKSIARACVELGFPHSYLGLESLTGRREVWFLNGWQSVEEQKQVAQEYERNTPLVEILTAQGTRKSELVIQRINLFANFNRDLSRGAMWSMGQGRFLIITLIAGDRLPEGTVFEAGAGMKVVILSATTRAQAFATAKRVAATSRVFAIRSDWSNPAEEWVSVDRAFWRLAPKLR